MSDSLKKSKQSQSSASYRSDQSDKFSKSEASIASISLDTQYYLSMITPIQKNSQQHKNILAELRKNGFEYNKLYSFTFKKKIINSSRDSIKYEIQYGNFKTYINVFMGEYNFDKITRKVIGQGKFGRALLFNYQQKPIIAKQITFKGGKKPIKNILTEVFWVKLASILNIGAKFEMFYGYDTIFLKGKCEYLMEQCADVILPLAQQIFDETQFERTLQVRLKKIIGLLGSFNIIHGDIKPQHIVWSPIQKMFVILDFGMSIFVKQSLGKKTITSYFGSYSYSSPEMKKTLLLKTEMPVDLYFNDLYGLNKTLTTLKQICKKRVDDFYEQNQQLQCSKWGILVNLFKLKFSIFEQNFGQVKILCSEQKFLSKCFLKIIKDEPTKNKFNPLSDIYLKSLGQLLKSQTKQDKQKDDMLIQQIAYMEILKCQDINIYDDLTNQDNLQEMYYNKSLSSFLKNIGMENLFEFLFKEKNQSDSSLRKRIIVAKYIFLSEISQSMDKQTPINVICQVIFLFQKYFFEVGNLRQLKKIQKMFKLTLEPKLLQKVQLDICKVFLSNPRLWICEFIQDLFVYLKTKQNKNIRKTWQWLITKSSINSQFIKNSTQGLIGCCIDFIKEIDKKISSNCIRISYHKSQQSNFLLKKLYDELDETKKFKVQNLQHSILDSNQKQIPINQTELKLHILLQGVLNLQTQKYNYFLKTQYSLNTILRNTIWNIIPSLQKKQYSFFQFRLIQMFQDIFVIDMIEGLNTFMKFKLIFRKYITELKETKSLLINFLDNIAIQKILNQIDDDPLSIKELFEHFLELTEFYFAIPVNQEQKKCITMNLTMILKQINIYVTENSDKWWAKQQSKIMTLKKVAQMFLESRMNMNNIKNIKDLLQLACQYVQKYPRDNLSIFLTINSANITRDSKSIVQFWQLLQSISSQHLYFQVLTHNIDTFTIVISKLFAEDKFQQCLKLLERYGNLAKTVDFYNSKSIAIFSFFVRQISHRMGLKNFVQDINKFSLIRVIQSPRLSFILLFFYEKHSYLLSLNNKIRFIKLIACGLSKIQIRYQKYSEIKCNLYTFYRQCLGIKNTRKYFINLKRQNLFSYHQFTQLYKAIATYKQKNFKKTTVKLDCDKKFMIKECLFNKLQNIPRIIKLIEDQDQFWRRNILIQ